MSDRDTNMTKEHCRMDDFIVLHGRERNGDKSERVAINLSHVDSIKSCMDERGFYTDVHLINGHGFIVHEDFSEVMKLITSK